MKAPGTRGGPRWSGFWLASAGWGGLLAAVLGVGLVVAQWPESVLFAVGAALVVGLALLAETGR